MITVWGRRNSVNVQKGMWALGELEQPYDRRDMGGSFGSGAEYTTMNPQKTVPTIQDKDRTLWESNACVRYLCREYGRGSLWSDDPEILALSDQWMDYQACIFSTALIQVFLNKIRLPATKASAEQLARGVASCAMLLEKLDSHFSDSLFITGDEFTMGDIPLGACMYRYFNMDIERPFIPNIERWYKSLASRTAYQKHVMIPFGTDLNSWNEQEALNAEVQ